MAREPSGKNRYYLHRRGTVYVGMDRSKRQYKQKRYLLWKICDLLDIVNASKVIANQQYASFPETFQLDLSFCQLYEFLKRHKELAWNDQLPQSSCLCELCENFSKRYQSESKIKDCGNQCT